MKKEFSKGVILDRVKDYYNLKTNSELADFMGVSKSTISNWYARNSIDYDILFTRCTDANLNWLITGEQNPVNESVKNEDITEMDSLPFTENPSDDFIERKHFSGYFALYEYLARKSSYSEIKKQYEDIISDLYFAYHYTSYYDSSERFNNEYIKFKKGELSKKDLLTSFNEIVEKNKKLFTILEPYVDILHELYQKLDKFNDENDNLFSKVFITDIDK